MSEMQFITNTHSDARPGGLGPWLELYHHAIAQGDDATAGRALAELRRHGYAVASAPPEATPCPDC